MTIRHRTQYMVVNAAVITASAIQLARGLRVFVVIMAAIVFLMVGNLTVYLAGSRQRAIERQRRRDYYAGSVNDE